MNYKFLFLSALLITWSSSILAVGVSEFELELTREAPDCVNAKKLLLAVDADARRLDTYSNSVTESLSTVEGLTVSLNQGCDSLLASYTQASFLETTSTAFSNMATLQEKLKAGLIGSGIDHELRNHLKITLEMLGEISEDRMSSNAEEANMKCEEGRSRLQTLSEGLNTVLASIKSSYLEAFIPSRREEINRVLESCPITQTGFISKTYLGTGNEFEQRVPRARFMDYKITFDKPFAEIPNVALSLAGFDLDTELPAVAALVQRVTENDFTFRVHLVPYARLYSVEVSYLATLPESSGIHPVLHVVDIARDRDLAKISDEVGPRYVEKTVPLPRGFENEKVGVVTYLSGFSFGAGADPRVKASVTAVASNEFTLRYSTSGSTRFMSAITYNLVYKTDKGINSNANEASPLKTGQLYTGFGARSETAKSLSMGVFRNQPEVFVGLFAFDFTNGYRYRISEEARLGLDESKKNKVDLLFNTAGDSKVNMVKSSIFYTCHSKQC